MNMVKILLLAACLFCLCDARSESRDGYSGSGGNGMTRSDHSGSRSGSSSGKKGSTKKSRDSKKRSSSSRKDSRNSDRDSQKGSGSRDGGSYGSGGSGGSSARGQHAPAPEKDQVCCLKDGAPSSVSCGVAGTAYCDSSYCVLVDGDECPTSDLTEQPSVEPTMEPTTLWTTSQKPTVAMDSEASQLSVSGVTVVRWVSPLEMVMEDQNLVYLAAAAAMTMLMVVFYGCSRKEANKGAVYEELV